LVVDQPGNALRLEARDLPVHSRARAPQKPAETALLPALIVESDDLQASSDAIGMGMILPPCGLLRRGDGALGPELLDRAVTEGVAEGEAQDAGEFAGMKAGVERFEPVHRLADGTWGPRGSASRSDVERCGHQSQPSLLLEGALEGAHGVRMGLRFLGPWQDHPIGKDHQGTDHLMRHWI